MTKNFLKKCIPSSIKSIIIIIIKMCYKKFIVAKNPANYSNIFITCKIKLKCRTSELETMKTVYQFVLLK